jgi:hypothetical protein
VSIIVNAINAAPTSKQRAEVLRAALAQTDVRAAALSARVVTTLVAIEAMAIVDQISRSAQRKWGPAGRATGRRSSPRRSRCWPPTRRPGSQSAEPPRGG